MTTLKESIKACEQHLKNISKLNVRGNLADLGDLHCDKRKPENPDRPKKNTTRILSANAVVLKDCKEPEPSRQRTPSIRNSIPSNYSNLCTNPFALSWEPDYMRRPL